MTEILAEQTTRFLQSMNPIGDDVVRAMEEHGKTHGPTAVGREVGQFLRVLAELAGADQISSSGPATATPRTGSPSAGPMSS